VTEIRQVLREEPTAEHALRLSDTDPGRPRRGRVGQRRRDAPPRAYPEEPAPPTRARGEITQVGSIAEGALAVELVRRVLARFPDLDTPNRPTPTPSPSC